MRVNLRNAVRRGFYLDSVALMRLSREIAALSGVEDAALMMATPANKAILAEAGLLDPDGPSAGANDLILAVRAREAEAADAALAAASLLLERQPSAGDAAVPQHPRSLRGALGAQPGANLALISVPGDYAAAEARKALSCGLDVMIFSDNVPLAEEVALKREGKALGRLVLGPDCGTAIIGGTPLAFANRVPRGDIGLIGASGTGLQEVSCLLAVAGRGISQAIGVGSRDLGREVGALSPTSRPSTCSTPIACEIPRPATASRQLTSCRPVPEAPIRPISPRGTRLANASGVPPMMAVPQSGPSTKRPSALPSRLSATSSARGTLSLKIITSRPQLSALRASAAA